jgi:heparanase 2
LRAGPHAHVTMRWSRYTSFRPLPDYWASVLHKRLVGTAVLDVSGSLEMGRAVRSWASCAHRNAAAPRGAITLLILNTAGSVATVRAIGGGGRDLLADGWDEYLLTPADSAAGLSSADVALNGKALAMEG